MTPDVEYEEYEAPKQPDFFSFPVSDTWYTITFLKELDPSDQFEVGKKGKKQPAPVWLIREGGKEFRLTLTSSRLTDCLGKAIAKFGKLDGLTVDIMPVGKDKERTYRIRWAKNAQGRLA